MKNYIWHSELESKIFSILKTDKNGISQDEAKKRLKEYGSNILPKKKKVSDFIIFLSQLKSPLVYILLFALAISLFLKNWLDLLVILAVVVMNTIIGFFNEKKANDSIGKLKEFIQYQARVLRDGMEYKIFAQEVVPGDIIFLEEGERVPADVRILEVSDLEIIETTLTGESVPSKKSKEPIDLGCVLADRENMAYMGTYISKGRGMGVVCETAGKTELGSIARLILETPEKKTPLQIRLGELTKTITLSVVAIALFVVVVGVFKGKPFLEALDGHETGIFYTGLVLAVAAIPEGLLVAVTVILALGIQKIHQRKALVRQLAAAETLGSTSVICTDKTGTLTEGKMKVVKIALPDTTFDLPSQLKGKKKKYLEYALTIGTCANDGSIENYNKDITEWLGIGDTTDTALLFAGAQSGLDKVLLEKKLPRIDEITFDSNKKFMATLHAFNETQNIIYAKGAPESILQRTRFIKIDGMKHEMNDRYLSKLERIFERMTKEGLRVIALAYKKTSEKKFHNGEVSDLIFVGFSGIQDPLRADAQETFLETKKAGLRTVIVTGDHKYTAENIAREMGMQVKEDNVLEGSELDKMTDEDLYNRIKSIEIFARVSPHHKLRIIDAWQKRGEVVAMTGDGVNDAPALKNADIGIAFNSGTDVAKENSDLILLDNNFKTIVAAIEQGRIIFNNIRKVILYLLSNSFAEVALILASLVFEFPLPLLPVQILWMNLIDDGLPTLAFTKEKGEKDILFERPRKKTETIIHPRMKFFILCVTTAINIPLFLIFIWLLQSKSGYSLDHARTIIFTALSLSTILYSYSYRTYQHSIFQKNIFENYYLNFAVIMGVILQLLAVYLPVLQKTLHTVSLSSFDWLIILSFSFFTVFVIEIAKFFLFHVSRRQDFIKV